MSLWFVCAFKFASKWLFTFYDTAIVLVSVHVSSSELNSTLLRFFLLLNSVWHKVCLPLSSGVEQKTYLECSQHLGDKHSNDVYDFRYHLAPTNADDEEWHYLPQSLELHRKFQNHLKFSSFFWKDLLTTLSCSILFVLK